jgi:small subunit ribosomal protein S16
MSVKIRLQRHGKKGKPFFHIVAADARSPRDGKFIERIGSYNPNTNPATIVLNNDRAINWLNNGAQPTDTARAILSYSGVMMRHHLAKGVSKGALTQEQADERLAAWTADKQAKIQSKVDKLLSDKKDASNKALKHERAVNEARLKAMTEAAAEASASREEASAEAEEAPAAEVAVEEAPVAETAVEEAPVAETAVEESPVAEVAAEEASVAEVAVEEAPVAEVAVEEAPAAEEAAEEATEEAPAAE